MAALMMCTSVVLLLVGMVGGIAMGVQQNFVLSPAHTHLNLIGGVLLFLFGLYYKVFQKAAESKLAKIQGFLHIVGAIVFPVGIAIVLLNGHTFEVFPIVGSFIVIASTVLFLIVVLRTANTDPRSA